MKSNGLRRRAPWIIILTILFSSACTSTAIPPAIIGLPATVTPVPSMPLPPAAAGPTLRAATTATFSPAPLPTVESLGATVTARLLSCRYGPGPDYLFLYGLRQGANIRLIGRTDGENWHWVYVEGRHRCWVNTNFIDIQGSWMSLPVVYPGSAKLPVSPYYPPTTVIRAVRKLDEVTVQWLDIPLRAGDEEDQFMQHYIAEIWRCENGRLLFQPLATNELSVTFVDQPGCSLPSHGRLFVQEKHGFAGPADIPWPHSQ